MVLFTDSAKRRARSMGVSPDELAADLLNSVVAIDSVIACNPDLLGETASVLLHLQANLSQSAALRTAAVVVRDAQDICRFACAFAYSVWFRCLR